MSLQQSRVAEAVTSSRAGAHCDQVINDGVVAARGHGLHVLLLVLADVVKHVVQVAAHNKTHQLVGQHVLLSSKAG